MCHRTWGWRNGVAGTKHRRPESQRDTRRRFEQWADNPRCAANTISAVHNIKMAKVAERAGYEPTFGASPFALFRGDQFERNLLADEGARLLPELERTEVIATGASGLHDLRIRMNGGHDSTLLDLDAAEDQTLDLLRAIGSARGPAVDELPTIVAAATLKLPKGVMLPEALLIIDLLVVRPGDDDRAEILVGEVKTYPDRGGFTDTKQLAQARAQLGLYLHALRTVTVDWDDNERPSFRDDGFLVLSRPGSDFPRVRANEDLRYQASRAESGFDLLETAAQLLDVEWDDDAEDVDRFDAVLGADTNYCEACLSFCDLAERCHAAAVAARNPNILGDEAARFVGRIDLDRVCELLDGAAAVDDTERELLDRIRAAEDPGWA